MTKEQGETSENPRRPNGFRLGTLALLTNVLVIAGCACIVAKERALRRQAEVSGEAALSSQQLEYAQMLDAKESEIRAARSLTVDCASSWENWQISSGDGCQQDGPYCIQSTNYPQPYPSSATCSIQFASDIQLVVSVLDFSTEVDADQVLFDGVRHSGTLLPKPFKPSSDSSISWIADENDDVASSGWKLCLRESCANLTCPAGWSKRSAADVIPCGNLTCSDDDVPTCCERRARCRLPDSANISGNFTIPTGCSSETDSLIEDCLLTCAGDADALDGFHLPQRCNEESLGLFSMPTCAEVQSSWQFPWEIQGPCEAYGAGCVSSAGIGGTYSHNEVCFLNVASGQLQDQSAYRAWVTYLDSEANFDQLITSMSDPYYENITNPGTMTFHPAVPSSESQFLSGLWSPQDTPKGPFSLEKMFMWSTDSSLAQTGFILCAQAQCSTMTCPPGYHFNCEAASKWCSRHECGREEDVETCCLPETPEFLSVYEITSGDAANLTWCSSTTTSTTPGSTTRSILTGDDFTGQLILELAQPMIENGTEEVELAVATIEEGFRRLASLENPFPGYVQLQWELLENGTAIDVAYRVAGSETELDDATFADVYQEFVVHNATLGMFTGVRLWTTREDSSGTDRTGFREFSSRCGDLYVCDDDDDNPPCWRDNTFGAVCSQIYQEGFCTSSPSVPGPGYCHHVGGGEDCASSPSWVASFTNWLRTAIDPTWGPQSVSEVCCACGGGVCDDGLTRRFPSLMPTICIPCLAGRTSDNSEGAICRNCAAGRRASTPASRWCSSCARGQYGDEEGMTACKTCEVGKVSNIWRATACELCPVGTFSLDPETCEECPAGKVARLNGSSDCEECPPGRFTAESGRGECSPCAAGSFQGGLGQTTCLACAAGRFGPGGGSSACTACPKGTNQSSLGSSECSECQMGHYAQQEGQEQCIQCPGGEEAMEIGASLCDRCVPGNFKPAGEMNCSACEDGSVAFAEGMTACYTCPEGEFAENPTECTACHPGKFGAAAGLTACHSCPLGTHVAVVGSTGCVDCLIGEFTNITGLTECLICSPGSYSGLRGLSACESCGLGKAASSSGSTECDTCIAGTFADVPGLSTCPECQAGMYSPVIASTSCISCQAGRFSGASAQVECALCEPGRYASQLGMSDCTRCNATLPGVAEYWTTMSPPTADEKLAGRKAWTELRGALNVTSCGCRPGTQPVGDICEPCGEGLICLGMGELDIVKGYAWDGEYSVWDCSLAVDEACPGGEPGRCMPGRDETAIACAICLEKMVPVTSGACAKCKDADYLVPSLMSIGVIGIAVVCYCIFDSPKRKRPKLSFLLIVASTGQLVTIIQQLGIISLIDVKWGDPLLEAFSVIGAITFFDMDVLRPSCVFMMDVVTKYTVRIGAVFISLVVVCFAHLMSQLIQHRRTWRTRWPSLWCALGTIVLTFFVSILSTMLSPIQCRKHPNDRKTIAWYPSVACWEGEDHTTMIIIGGLSCLLPAVFLAACFWAVHSFPRKLATAEATFLNAWAFLFFRYAGEAYWYGPVMLIRNALVSICPVIVSPVSQILALEFIMLISLVLLLLFLPWRVKEANYLDTGSHICLLTLTMMASFFVEDRETHFIAVLGVVLIIAIPVIVLVVAGYGGLQILYSIKKPYQFFLCHHKLGAGCFCRLLKMKLVRRIRRKVFIDVDDLTNLDMLFDIVAHGTQTLVAVSSPLLLMRPWCVGEITVAHRSRVKMLPVYMPGVPPPSEEFITDFLKYVPDISCLTQFSIDLEMIQDALDALATTDFLRIPEELRDDTVDCFCTQMIAAGKSAVKQHENTQASNDKRVVSKNASGIIIICNKQEYEAAASAMILATMFNPIVQHKENCLASVLSCGQEVPLTTHKAMLICSNGVFTAKVMEALLACEDRSAPVLPIMNVTNFIFPSVEWMEDQPVFRDMEPSLRTRSVRLVKAIFLEIAVDFQPSALSGTEATLKIKAKEIADRILGNMQRLSDVTGSQARVSGESLGTKDKDGLSTARTTTSLRPSQSQASSMPISSKSLTICHWEEFW